jgi:hypothetical protein
MTVDQVSDEDLAKIAQLRSLLIEDLKGNEYYDTDFNLLRWIQGWHDLKVDEIARKLRLHLKMRYAIVIIDFELKTIKIRYTSFLTFILV